MRLQGVMTKLAAHAEKILGDLRFKIDRPKGFKKEWPGGRSWTYPVDYGYVPGLKEKGGDGESLDAFVGDDPAGHLESFQKLRRDGGRMVPDETKFLLGLTDAERNAIYKFYGDEVNARRTYEDMDAVKAAMKRLDGKHRSPPKAKEASRDNPWAEITPEGPIVGEDKDYDHARAKMKFALLTEVNDRETSPENAVVTGTQDQVASPKKAPSSKLMGPPKNPTLPKPINVPQSSAPQILSFKGSMYAPADGYTAPLDMSVPDAGNTVTEPNNNRSAEHDAVLDQISRFFAERIDSHRNIAPSGNSESTHGAIPSLDGAG